jgi:hypothetical protein
MNENLGKLFDGYKAGVCTFPQRQQDFERTFHRIDMRKELVPQFEDVDYEEADTISTARSIFDKCLQHINGSR